MSMLRALFTLYDGMTSINSTPVQCHHQRLTRTTRPPLLHQSELRNEGVGAVIYLVLEINLIRMRANSSRFLGGGKLIPVVAKVRNLKQWTPTLDKIFRGGACFAHKQENRNKPTMVTLLLPYSSWTAAIQSGRRDARRNQSHQQTQGNVLWQREFSIDNLNTNSFSWESKRIFFYFPQISCSRQVRTHPPHHTYKRSPT
jgi:hypothetical protein